MRLFHSLPLLAGLALAACGGSSDEDLSDEALAMDEVMGMQDNGIMPSPGQYTADVQLVSFDIPGVSDSNINMDMLLREMEEGAAAQSTYCVTDRMDREAWVSEMTDNTCSLSRIAAEGGSIDLAMTCAAEDGPQGSINMTGTAGETAADMEMAFTQPIPGVGDADIVMRVQSQRTGDCS